MEAMKTACSVMGAYAFALTFVPHPLRSKLEMWMRGVWEKLFSTADPFAYIEVPCKSSALSKSILGQALNAQYVDPYMLSSNSLDEDVGLYLGSLDLEFATRRVSVFGLLDADDSTKHDAQGFLFSLPLNESLADTFSGAKLSWTHTRKSNGRERNMQYLPAEARDEDNVFLLTMLKSDRHHILRPYLCHITTTASEIRCRNTLRTLYINNQYNAKWSPIAFQHHSTFDTIALDGDLAERIQADLKAFSESKDYYHRVGRAWKRGYLLYGPPGTGKSSLIAAIANFMQYDIYDIELTNVTSNSQLKSLLMNTERKAVIVIEDIDCSMGNISNREPSTSDQSACRDVDGRGSRRTTQPADQQQKLTLSGLLNFVDGLLSCIGEERIFIFTTNHKEELDAALLRCGRMDMHILLSFCTFSIFRKLAFNYLGIKDHALYEELEEAMRREVKITPASIAEILISARKDPDTAIQKVLVAVKAEEPLGSNLEEGHCAQSEHWPEGAAVDEEVDESNEPKIS